MQGIPGFDCFAFPGQAKMQWLRAHTPLAWCGYYLAPAPSHTDPSWMGTRALLQAAGWGLAPIHVGQQLAGPGSHIVTAAQGSLDGAAAATLMTAEGFAPGTTVFLDLEDGPPLAAPRTGYVAAWANAVTAAGFAPGIYCSHGCAAEAQALVPAARIWAYRVATDSVHDIQAAAIQAPAPAACGYPGAALWQHDQNARLILPASPANRLVVDLSTALTADPCAP